MEITLTKSKEIFNRLDNREKNMVMGTIVDSRRRYIMSGITVDIPYWFISVFPDPFHGISKTDRESFLDITTAEEFGIQVVYYLSCFLLVKRGEVI